MGYTFIDHNDECPPTWVSPPTLYVLVSISHEGKAMFQQLERKKSHEYLDLTCTYTLLLFTCKYPLYAGT